MIYIAPSLLAANYMRLEEEIHSVEQSGADYLHLDIMDGHFVPNLSFGYDMLAQLKKITSLPIDVHLMLSQPENYIEKFAQSGADIISVHVESSPHIHRLIQQIKQCGCLAGVVLTPGTPAHHLDTVLSEVDLVLQMTVNPGFGGQSFINETLINIQYLAEWKKQHNLNYLIEVDGGINVETAQICKAAGANVLVAGTTFFKSHDRANIVSRLRAI